MPPTADVLPQSQLGLACHIVARVWLFCAQVHGFTHQKFDEFIGLDPNSRVPVKVGRGGVFGGTRPYLEIAGMPPPPHAPCKVSVSLQLGSMCLRFCTVRKSQTLS